MKKNQLTTTKSTALILGKSKSLMKITKKLLEGKKKELVRKSQDITAHKDITLIGDLMWEKDSREMTWNEGMEYAKSLRLGGYDDWRLPTLKELGEVVTLCGGELTTFGDDDWDKKIGRNRENTLYQEAYKGKGFAYGYYWSSTTHAYNSYTAWYVHFYGGYQASRDKYHSYYVRCVRAGQ